MREYASPVIFKELCAQIDLPPEVTEWLVSYLDKMDFSLLLPHFEGLFSLETGDAAVKNIPELLKSNGPADTEHHVKALAIYLMAALHTREIYREMGIDDKIYIDTIKVFRRFLYEYRESYGYFSFDRHFWIYRQLAARLFRLGTLEFEICRLPMNFEKVGQASANDPVLSVHIPSDACMTREALDDSYREAGMFFARFFPEYEYKCICCSTWLLSPVLKEILKPGSRILNFQSDYEITHVNLEVNSGLKWVFKRAYDDYNDLPEDTSLMRGMKQILLSGGKTGTAAGYVKSGAYKEG
jgi:hypothetical protein